MLVLCIVELHAPAMNFKPISLNLTRGFSLIYTPSFFATPANEFFNLGLTYCVAHVHRIYFDFIVLMNNLFFGDCFLHE